jgi:DNA polymerase I-like protein with 3'-5' exonuclease and polymerase domains
MRPDSFGLFWHDRPNDNARCSAPRVIPDVPDTGWCAPAQFPRLEAADVLCVDVETYDPHLLTNGPGWATGDGHVVGIAVGTHDAQWYFPMRHEYGGGNMDPDNVLRWARDELGRERQIKIGANIAYDCGWLRHSGVPVAGICLDIQYAEALLDAHRASYALSSLANTYLGEGKTEDELYAWTQQAYGGPAGRRQAGNIYRAPAALVGPYAEGDVRLPLRIYEQQRKRLRQEDLLDLFRMECALIPLLVEMRMRGVRVDVQRAERVRDDMHRRESEIQARLDTLTKRKGFNPDIKDDMVAAFEHVGIKYPRTAKGNPSFTKSFLESLDHELPQLITGLRRLVKARGTFIEGYILDKHHNGRIHCQFHPLKADNNGTISGRFSSSTPNLQNIPSRDKEMRKLIRGCFLPEEGEQWFAPDYSQIEYRLMINAACGKGADEARELFQREPRTDYHAFTGDLVNEILGVQLDRKPVKNINFGKIFGMGKDKLLGMLHTMTPEQAEQFFNAYDEAIPYAKTTAQKAMNTAARRGYIKTVLGRRARFPFWEHAQWDKRGTVVRDRTEIDGPAVRAYTHKALNAYTQGSAADIIKQAMVNIWQAGLAVPLVQVHDELGFSLTPGKQAEEIVELMEHAVEIKVPLLVDAAWGSDWGHVK